MAKRPPDRRERRTRERVPEIAHTRAVWDFDRSTLNRAWIAYHKLPLTDRIFQRFGQWFMNNYSIEGYESWPAVFYERRAAIAFELLSNLVEEKARKS